MSAIQRITTAPAYIGGFASAAISDNSEVIYIGGGTASKGYKSTDNGATWSELPLLGGSYLYWYSIAVSSNGAIVYVAASNKVFKSTDYGATFTNIFTASSAANFVASICCSSDGSIAYFTPLNQNIHKVVNDGTPAETTSAVAVGASLSFSAISCSADGSVVAFSDSTTTIRVSKNGGAAWTSLSTTVASWILTVAGDGKTVYGAQSGYLIIINTTATPTIATTKTLGGGIYRAIDTSYDGMIVLAVSLDNRFAKSVDAGQTFAVDTTSITNFGSVTCIVASRTADRALIIGRTPATPYAGVAFMYTGTGSDIYSVAAPCFLADARVQTLSGPVAIADLKEGDIVLSAEGKPVSIQRIVAKHVKPTIQNIPYIIPAGTWGAQVDLPISPDHRVAVPGKGLVKASALGLDRLIMTKPFTYYNLEVENCENVVVEGVAVESLAHTKQYHLSVAEFGALIARLERSGKGSLAAKLMGKARQQGTMINLPLYLQRK